MAERWRRSPEGVRWCVCCLLFSIQIVNSLAQIQSADIGERLKTRNGQLVGLTLGNRSQGLPTLFEGKRNVGRDHRHQDKDSLPVNTGDQEDKVGNSSVLRLFSSGQSDVENFTGSNETFGETNLGIANTRDVFSPNVAHQTGPQNAPMTETIERILKQYQHSGDKTFTPTGNQASKTTATILQSEAKTENFQTQDNTDGSSVEKHSEKTHVNSRSTTVHMAVPQATPKEKQRPKINGAKKDNISNRSDTHNETNMINRTTRKPLTQTSDKTLRLTSKASSIVTKETPGGLSTLKSDGYSKPALRSPLSALLSPSTSEPHLTLSHRNLVFNPNTKEPNASFATDAQLSSSTTSAISKTDPKKLTKDISMTGRNAGSSSVPSQTQEPKAPFFHISEDKDMTEHVTIKDSSSGTLNAQATRELSPKMTHSPQNTREVHGAATTYPNHQPAWKTSLPYEMHLTRRRAGKLRSTARLRRSTRDLIDNDSTLPSSRKKSNKVVLTDNVTFQPSHLNLLKAKKRHVPHHDSKLLGDLDCSDLGEGHTHHSIQWSDGTTLIVTLDGDGEAVTVTWEIIAGNIKVPKGRIRHGRDTVSGAADRHLEGVNDAEVTKPSSLDIRPEVAEHVGSTERLVNGFVVSYRIPGDEEYDSSRLRVSVRSFVLHQLHPDEDYTICVHAMSGRQPVYEECADWSRSLLRKKATMGILAGSLFFLPCVVVIIIIIRKDRHMRAKAGSGDNSWQCTHPSLVRGFSTCEESQEVLVNEASRGSYSRTADTAPSLVYIHDGTGSTRVHELQQLRNPSQLASEQASPSSPEHLRSRVKDQSGLKTSTPQDSMNNLLETDILADRDLTLFKGVEEEVTDNAYSNPTAAIANYISCSPGSSSQQIHIGEAPDPNRETNI